MPSLDMSIPWPVIELMSIPSMSIAMVADSGVCSGTICHCFKEKWVRRKRKKFGKRSQEELSMGQETRRT